MKVFLFDISILFKRLVFCVLCCLFVSTLSAQITYRSPVDIPIQLAGNFGEVRNNHYHAGLDIRTQQQEGLPIHAIAEGYISRVKPSGLGYGNVVYINHPNGKTSVYAHLREFVGPLYDYVFKHQLMQEKFEVELFPPADSLKVSAGEVFALSGNSGSSAGPHLHFEIRDTKTEEIINPQLEGIKIKDNVPPDVRSITLYPLDPAGRINGISAPKTILVSAKTGFVVGEEIQVTGRLGVGVSTSDRATGSSNANGVFSLALFMDSIMMFSQKLDKYAFSETRQINSLVNYADKLAGKQTVQKLFASGCTNFTGIKRGPGILFKKDFSIHTISVIVADLEGNFREVKLKVQFLPIQKTDRLLGGKYIACGASGFYKDKELDVLFPENSLFDTLDFTVTKLPKPFTALCPEFVLSSYFIPVYNPYSLTIRVPNLPEKLRDKVVIAYKDKGKNWISQGGTLRGDEITQKVKGFGSFTVWADTIAPRISSVNVNAKNVLTQNTVLTLKISDNFSGIASYRVEVNGQWLLMEYDAKTARIFGKLKNIKGPAIPAGRNTFKVEVTDICKNKATWTTQITVK